VKGYERQSRCYNLAVPPLRVLIVSTAEDLLIVDALIERLAGTLEVYAWTEDVFTLSANPLDSLTKVVSTVDCAIFVARTAGGRRVSANLMSELGFCAGYLGATRVGVVSNSSSLQSLSDLRDSASFLTAARGERLSPRELSSLATAIRSWIRTLGRRRFRVSQHPAPNELLFRKGSPQRRRRANKIRTKGAGSLFISYSHTDVRWLAKIKTMLSPLLRHGKLELWDDTKIKPGARWRTEIKRAIGEARVALLLVSAPFLASPFIAKQELPPLLRAARRDGLTIFWVYVSPCLYRNTPIAKYQAAHAITKPLDALSSAKQNQALLDIAENIASSLRAA
jgi:hypothetical protein